jgi:hypothetical protein
MNARARLSVRLAHLFGVGAALVDAHFLGTSTVAAERRMWRHLPGCLACRLRYDARAALEALEAGDAGDGGADRAAAGRIGRALFAEPPRRTRAWALPAGLALAGAAAAMLLLPRPEAPVGRGPDRGAAEAPAFRARGATTAAPGLGPALVVFRLRPGETPQRSGAVVRAVDSLAFAYTNPTGATHLMVFAIDGAGRIFWYWPAWTDPDRDPEAVPIARSSETIELAEAVRQPLAPGRLRVQALFLDGPRRVREVEAAIGRGELGTLGGRALTEELEVLP